jgi:allantoinase
MEPRPYGALTYSPIIDRPPLKWPNGARLAVWIIPNIEFRPMDQLMRDGEKILPNVGPWSRRDYGNRVGVFRLMEAFETRGIRGTVALNSDVCAVHPRVVERACQLNWELMGHCETNAKPLHHLPAGEERNTIKRVLDVIEKASGKRPRGWLGPGMNETWNTPENLAAEGLTYCADYCNDDQPYRMTVGKPPLIALPYTLELNDTHIIIQKGYSSVQFGKGIKRAFETLYREGRETSKVMAIALHPWISGTPQNIGPLTDALDHMAGHDGVWFATGSEIVDAYVAQTK